MRQIYRSYLPPFHTPLKELGALIVMSTRPNALHAQKQRLVLELGVQVAQSLYLWACHDKMETGVRKCE